jgi:N-acetylneuraminate synthase
MHLTNLKHFFELYGIFRDMNVDIGKHCKLIAEVGLSHEGSLGLAFANIASAKASGADLVKFQYHIPTVESSKYEKFRIDFSQQDKTRWDYWDRTTFTTDNWKKIIDHCENNSIEFCVSVFSSQACTEMIDLGVKNIKLGSGDLTNKEIFDVLKGWKGNLFISTGLATFSEIEEAITNYSEFLSNGSLTVFQCTSKYPTPLNQVGINVMEKIRNRWKVNIGLSDHSVGIDAAIVAICSGADFIEKHVTFSKSMFGPDVSSSVTFEELSRLAKFRDNYQLITQQVDKDALSKELSNERLIFGRSLGLKREFQKGEIVTEQDFCLRKPGGGLNWEERKLFVGQKLNRDIELGDFITRSDFNIEKR